MPLRTQIFVCDAKSPAGPGLLHHLQSQGAEPAKPLLPPLRNPQYCGPQNTPPPIYQALLGQYLLGCVVGPPPPTGEGGPQHIPADSCLATLCMQVVECSGAPPLVEPPTHTNFICRYYGRYKELGIIHPLQQSFLLVQWTCRCGGSCVLRAVGQGVKEISDGILSCAGNTMIK